jgi:hypothetical protein
MTTVRYIAAMPFLALAFAFWAAGMGMAKLSNGTAAAWVMGPRRR